MKTELNEMLNEMSDNETFVYVIRTENDMLSREESNSNLWDVEIYDIEKGKNLYRIPIRDLRIGESYFDKKGEYKGYRVN